LGGAVLDGPKLAVPLADLIYASSRDVQREWSLFYFARKESKSDFDILGWFFELGVIHLEWLMLPQAAGILPCGPGGSALGW
jgi:hypothetical protein